MDLNTILLLLDTGLSFVVILMLIKILAAVKADTTAERNLVKQNIRLQKEINDLLSGQNLPPEVQKKVDAIFTQSQKNYHQLSKGISDNQP